MAYQACISAMPNEIICLIVLHLSNGDLASFRRTQRFIKMAAHLEWRKRCLEDKDNCPALLWAAYRGKASLLRFLIDPREYPEVDVNSPEKKFNGLIHNPLSIASYLGQTEVVDILCNDNRVKVNHGAGNKLAVCGPQQGGSAALLYTARTRYPKVIQMLLSAGADPRTISKDTRSNILHIACEFGETMTLQQILKWRETSPDGLPDIEGRNKAGRTPLRVVFARHFHSHRNIVYRSRLLVPKSPAHDQGGPVSSLRTPDYNNRTFLWEIGTLSLRDKFERLSPGIDSTLWQVLPTANDHGFYSIIHHHHRYGRPISLVIKNSLLHLAQDLIDHGADIENLNPSFLQHPSSAISQQNIELIYFLHRNRLLDINSLNHDGLSALHVLLMEPFEDLFSFEALLALELMGADMFLPTGTEDPESPQELASESGWPSMLIQMFLTPPPKGLAGGPI